MKTPFRDPRLVKMYEICITVASDNFSEFYIPAGRSPYGPRAPRRGAGHRHGFWNGYYGAMRRDGSPAAVPGSLQYAAIRAGQAFRKGKRG